MILTYKYRLLPFPKQYAELDHLLNEQRLLYNAALQERIDCYRRTGKTRTFFDQCIALTEWRQSDPDASGVPPNLQRWTLKRVDDAFKAFFRRAKARIEKAGFPRFKSQDRWHSIGFHEWCGIRLKNSKLYLAGVRRSIRLRMHRPLPPQSVIKACVLTKDDTGWSICLQIKLPDVEPRPIKSVIGIDVGLQSLATLSTGEHVDNPRHLQKYEAELCLAQQALSRRHRRSNRRKEARKRVARIHRKIRNTRNTHLHQLSRSLVNTYDVIAIEKLNVKGLARGRLAKSVHDVAWGKLIQQLSYKAEGAGSRVVAVDAKYTSQLCSGCGILVKKDLSVRVHECADCGLVLDRDVNAARNILCRAVVGPEAINSLEISP